ncbi:bifunctional 4-hydroxy-3-methylbut-2-enyl diphosphate reductase/30S ribosomal protein S1 [Soehngenia longivitae]|uniref:4-hydroxy-3-methylbut-2-enyl diphosphate reductase n=1 Tax=Soehngenia longivitae TaxID=2562294 RepID=A0A4Z0D566_9FIRM|nr:bifunctional 4-hydroxy-3-methylbut-2-enyl diphosphate reductase/30S ribosomal protein S1 [Soehngenia longivitae]TFZ39779.1 bifunctional 4-hydroxy-3-methylbut-2-enyl diphosphate reductase/30S ribosomal protein S1 [Soehngenia longivitae]
MEVIISKNAGFCFGVERAINTALKTIENEEIVYSYGPLVHNQQVVDYLEDKGIITVDSIEGLMGKDTGAVIIRSHGLPKHTIEEIEKLGFKIVDCTCPFVKSVHNKVSEYSSKGYNIIIVGDKDHPEVIGINGWCDNQAYIVNTIEDAKNLDFMDKICIVSQTTNNIDKFTEISKIVEEKANEAIIFNTICNATRLRQESVAELAKQVDAMIVLGGNNSSNTKKLADISRIYNDNVYLLESISEISLQELNKFNKIGITAGASTPDWIIKEAVRVMENFNKDEMMEAIDSSFKRINRGDVLKGTVLYVTNNEVMVNINYKSDGIIQKEELSKDSNVNPKDIFKVGDEIDVYVLKLDDGEGNVVLSTKRVEYLKDWEKLEDKFKNDEIVEAKVKNVVKGGLIASINGINGFIPASQISVKFVKDLNQFVGKILKCKIIDFDVEKKKLILSSKAVEKEEKDKKKKDLWENIHENDIIKGRVQRITDFGAFVDVGGVDGLIHISDMAWYRIKHPSEVLKEGQEVEVKVLSIDQEKGKISLGLKQTLQEPWEEFIQNYKVGDVIEGEIVNLLDFGAFVRLINGVDGLLHVSQISNDHIEKPSDVLKIGDKIKVEIVDIDEENKKVNLSHKNVENNINNSSEE